MDERELEIQRAIQAIQRSLGQTGGSGGGPVPLQGVPTPFESGVVRADPSTIGMMDTRNPAQDAAIAAMRAADRGMEILPEDQIGPTENLGMEDSIFQILMETIIGEQGIPEGVSPEVIEAIRGDFGPTTIPAELQEIAIEIAEAGGFDEWYAQQDLEGPPEELPTELEEEADINEDTTLEDEIGVEPDMPIDIPPPTLPPREEEGDGDGEGEGEGEGEQQETAQGEGDEEEYQFPDYPQGDPNYGYPDGLPGGGRGGTIYDVPVQEEPGLTVGIGIPSISSGGDGGGGGGGGMLRTASKFTPYMGGISYQLPQDQMILYRPPTANEILTDFTNGLVRQRGMLV